MPAEVPRRQRRILHYVGGVPSHSATFGHGRSSKVIGQHATAALAFVTTSRFAPIVTRAAGASADTATAGDATAVAIRVANLKAPRCLFDVYPIARAERGARGLLAQRKAASSDAAASTAPILAVAARQVAAGSSAATTSAPVAAHTLAYVPKDITRAVPAVSSASCLSDPIVTTIVRGRPAWPDFATAHSWSPGPLPSGTIKQFACAPASAASLSTPAAAACLRSTLPQNEPAPVTKDASGQSFATGFIARFGFPAVATAHSAGSAGATCARGAWLDSSTCRATGSAAPSSSRHGVPAAASLCASGSSAYGNCLRSTFASAEPMVTASSAAGSCRLNVSCSPASATTTCDATGDVQEPPETFAVAYQDDEESPFEETYEDDGDEDEDEEEDGARYGVPVRQRYVPVGSPTPTSPPGWDVEP